MSNSRDNFHGESSDQSFSYHDPQKQQISQPQQQYSPKDYYPQPYSSKQPQPSVQALPQKHEYDQPPISSSQTSDQSKQLKTLKGIHQSSNQSQSQQQKQQELHSVQGLPLPPNPPKSNYHPPGTQTLDQSRQQELVSLGYSTKDDRDLSHRSFCHTQPSQQQLPPVRAPLPQNPPKSSQTWDQSWQQEHLQVVPSPGYSTKDDHDLQSHVSFNHPQQLQVPLIQNPRSPTSSSNQTRHQSQPRQPPNGAPLETQSNQPQKHRPPIEVSSKHQRPPNDTVLGPCFPNGHQPVMDVHSTTHGNRSMPQIMPTVQTGAKLPSNQPVLAYPSPSNEPVTAYPDPSYLPPNTRVTIITIETRDQSTNVPKSNSPPEPEAGLSSSKTEPKRDGCCCSIL